MKPLVKKIGCALLALALCLCVQMPVSSAGAQDYSGLIIKLSDTGDNVLLLQMRLRDLGYYPYKITGQFGRVTREAVLAFQQGNGLDADGVVGGRTATLLFSNEAKRVSNSDLRAYKQTPSPTPVKTKNPNLFYGEYVAWSDIKSSFDYKTQSEFVIRDFYTGVEYTCKTVGGYNHVDFEPATKSDTAKFLSTYGGYWSWDRRPVLVKLNGKWYAGSVNGMPHGYETISGNNMNGQCCLHFKNSRTHGTNAVCSKHQNCVKIAAGLTG